MFNWLYHCPQVHLMSAPNHELTADPATDANTAKAPLSFVKFLCRKIERETQLQAA